VKKGSNAIVKTSFLVTRAFAERLAKVAEADRRSVVAYIRIVLEDHVAANAKA
jgi:hypothetical protein